MDYNNFKEFKILFVSVLTQPDTWARSDHESGVNEPEGGREFAFLWSEGGCFPQTGLKWFWKFRFYVFFLLQFSGRGCVTFGSSGGSGVASHNGLSGSDHMWEWSPLLSLCPSMTCSCLIGQHCNELIRLVLLLLSCYKQTQPPHFVLRSVGKSLRFFSPLYFNFKSH